MKVLVLGGDGFCGWPTSLRVSRPGHEVIVVDDLSRLRIDVELGVESLTPIPLLIRLRAWEKLTGATIGFVSLDLATDYDGVHSLIARDQPTTMQNDIPLKWIPDPILLEDRLRLEVTSIARGYTHRCDPRRIPCVANWR